jgi:glucosamine kinase
MILIADSGSTKTEWLLVSKAEVQTAFTQGLHPLFLSAEAMEKIIERELPENFRTNVDALFFYGAGCAFEERRMKVRTVLSKLFPNTKTEIAGDLLGAARACCGEKRGIVSILGTGSSVCHYNGKEIESIRPSLGYILGDEGSGNHIGKKLIIDFFTGKMPTDLFEKFTKQYQLTREELIENVYKNEFPSRYLGSFAPFAHENIDTAYCKKMVRDCFTELFDRHIIPLYEKTKLPVNFNGSVAYTFKNILFELCRAKHIEVNEIIKSPGEKLAAYHK